jgi:hypothetical protein
VFSTTKDPVPLATVRASKSFCLAAEQLEDNQSPLDNQVLIIGIDVGTEGAIAALTPKRELLNVFEMPFVNGGPARRRNVNGEAEAVLIGVMGIPRMTPR